MSKNSSCPYSSTVCSLAVPFLYLLSENPCSTPQAIIYRKDEFIGFTGSADSIYFYVAN